MEIEMAAPFSARPSQRFISPEIIDFSVMPTARVCRLHPGRIFPPTDSGASEALIHATMMHPTIPPYELFEVTPYKLGDA